MKKQLFFIAIASLFSALASAADLYVRDAGAGGAYSTIAAAIAAATDGDRIIIRPKTGGLPYIGDFTINKSLSFVSEINFSKYAVQGLITFDPAAGRNISIHNISITGNIKYNTTIPFITGGRCNLNILNSLINGQIIASTSGTSLNLSGCTVTQEVDCLHGKLCGNDFSLNNYVYIQYEDTNPAIVQATSPIYIIANKISYLGVNTTKYQFYIKNNYFSVGNSSYYPSSINISDVLVNSTNYITNNYISNNFDSNFPNALVNISVSSTAGAVLISNNYFSLFSANAQAIRKNIVNPNFAVNVDYNMKYSQLALTFATVGITVGNNNFNGSVNGTVVSYIATSGAAIDSGDPDEEYSDLNLTRNDIACGGGSDAWSNYWSSTATQSQVLFLDVPSRIYQGTTTLQVEGMGYSK